MMCAYDISAIILISSQLVRSEESDSVGVSEEEVRFKRGAVFFEGFFFFPLPDFFSFYLRASLFELY